LKNLDFFRQKNYFQFKLCETSDQAKQLAFSRGVSCRTVTVDGDDFNPGGTLTGGSRPPTEPILQQLDAISASYKRRTEIDGRLKWIESETEIF
jgi:structural maintenance of chromosome 2